MKTYTILTIWCCKYGICIYIQYEHFCIVVNIVHIVYANIQYEHCSSYCLYCICKHIQNQQYGVVHIVYASIYNMKIVVDIVVHIISLYYIDILYKYNMNIGVLFILYIRKYTIFTMCCFHTQYEHCSCSYYICLYKHIIIKYDYCCC